MKTKFNNLELRSFLKTEFEEKENDVHVNKDSYIKWLESELIKARANEVKTSHDKALHKHVVSGSLPSEDEINHIMYRETNNLFVPRDWKDRFSYQFIFQTGFKNCYNQLVERWLGNDR